MPWDNCAERLRLMRDHSAAVRHYAGLVGRALDLMERGLESEVSAIRRTWRTAWQVAEEARIALYRHEADYGCTNR